MPKMQELIYKEKLDLMAREGCQFPNCGHGHENGKVKEVYLHARCHMRAGLEVFYLDGALYVQCEVCHKGVGAVAVASLNCKSEERTDE